MAGVATRVELQVHLKSSKICGRLRSMSDVLSIGEVSERSGVATSALRFYEQQGLIRAERNDSGHRRYPRAVIRLVAFIVFAQKVGLSLDEIAEALSTTTGAIKAALHRGRADCPVQEHSRARQPHPESGKESRRTKR